MSSVRTGSRSEGARGAGEGHMVWMGPGRTGGVAPWRDPCRGGGSFGIVEKGFRIQEEVGETDALVGEGEVRSAGSWDPTEADDPQCLQLLDLRRDLDITGDVMVDIGLLA